MRHRAPLRGNRGERGNGGTLRFFLVTHTHIFIFVFIHRHIHTKHDSSTLESKKCNDIADKTNRGKIKRDKRVPQATYHPPHEPELPHPSPAPRSNSFLSWRLKAGGDSPFKSLGSPLNSTLQCANRLEHEHFLAREQCN